MTLQQHRHSSFYCYITFTLSCKLFNTDFYISTFSSSEQAANLAGGLVCTVYGLRTAWQLSGTAGVIWSSKQTVGQVLVTYRVDCQHGWWNILVKSRVSYSIKQCKQSTHLPSLGLQPICGAVSL